MLCGQNGQFTFKKLMEPIFNTTLQEKNINTNWWKIKYGGMEEVDIQRFDNYKNKWEEEKH